ncbi:hypothetical protein TNCV_1761901 [Trichonephila clavipes]|nr:hypothetical protein TNCV_1761901 [Trichonephila clavipes]
MVRIHCFIDSRNLFFQRVTPQGLTTFSVHGEWYREMLQTYAPPSLQQRGCLQETISMHVEAPPHIACSFQPLQTHV